MGERLNKFDQILRGLFLILIGLGGILGAAFWWGFDAWSILSFVFLLLGIYSLYDIFSDRPV